jgi:hypothetical protein
MIKARRAAVRWRMGAQPAIGGRTVAGQGERVAEVVAGVADATQVDVQLPVGEPRGARWQK